VVEPLARSAALRCTVGYLAILKLWARADSRRDGPEVLFEETRPRWRGSPLANFHISEPKARQHAGKRLAGIFVGGLQDAVLQCGCLKLALSFLAYLAFKIRISRGEESGVA
jgi:hypothetical protein